MTPPTRTDLLQALQSVGIRTGDIIFVHSSIYRMGKLADTAIDDIPQAVTSILIDLLGPSGGLYAPTFTYKFCDGQPFDIRSTPSEMGVLTEYIRKQEESVRSPHPMQSIAGMGPNAVDVCNRDTRTTFTSGGPIDRLYELDAKVLLLGAPFQSTSLIHYVEEKCEVPYRCWKEFEGEYTNRNGDTDPVTYEMYVRDLDLNPKLDLSIIERELSECTIQKAQVGPAGIISFKFGDFVEKATELISKDPFAIIGEMNRS